VREEAIAAYHRLLSEDKSIGRELFSRLRREMMERSLSYGERPLGVSLRPHFLTEGQYRRLKLFSETVAGAFEKVATALVENPSLMERVRLRESERRFALVDPGFPLAGITTRLDAFVNGDQIKYVEYNAENPSSLPDQPGLNRILYGVHALRTFAERYSLREFDPVEALCQSLASTYIEWRGSHREAPRVAILDWANLPTESEFIYLRDYFVKRGLPTVIATPEELEYDGERLRAGEFKIDLVYKRVVIHELLERVEDIHPLLRAYSDGNVCLVNPFRCKIMHKKAAFELLTDEAFASWFSAAEMEVIKQSVPWTRRVSERKTQHLGRTVELVEHVRRNRAAFILKPNDDYGGRGIFFGRGLSASEWDEALSSALADGDYIVQEALQLETELFPVFDQERWSLEQMYVDTNPFIFRGRMEGAMVRLSDSPIVNVTSGGGETGFFVIDEKTGG
jgi:hypothetical protein